VGTSGTLAPAVGTLTLAVELRFMNYELRNKVSGFKFQVSGLPAGGRF